IARFTWAFAFAGLLTAASAAQASPTEAGADPAGTAQRVDPLPDVVDAQVQGLDTSEVRALISGFSPEVKAHLPEFDLKRIVLHPGEAGFDPAAIGRALLAYLGREVLADAWLLGQLIVLAVLCAVLKQLGDAFLNAGAAEAAFAVCFLLILYLGFQGFRMAVEVGRTTIDTMVSFMQAMLPLLATMLAAAGAVTTATVFQPILLALVNGVALLISTVFVPLVFLATVLGVVGGFAKGFPIRRLAGFVRGWSLTFLGLFFTLFMGVLAVRGAIAPIADGVGLRTAKFLTGAFIPVVGGQLSSALDVVIGGSLLIKNALGVFGLITVFVVTAFPIMKIASMLVIFRVGAAVIEPIADERLVDALGGFAGGIALLMAALITVALMFFIAITVVIAIGNLPAVMR
ncbi:MAG TPA: stage III sporulation protein AE, partial [Limnochordia bacterium]|nr:stage III sporulation protein AE [Limnochordia bacterium]